MPYTIAKQPHAEFDIYSVNQKKSVLLISADSIPGAVSAPFAPAMSITHYAPQGVALLSGGESHLRLILQGRMIGWETFGAQVPQPDYMLKPCARPVTRYGNRHLLWKDYVKAVLIEAAIMRESDHANLQLMGLNATNPNAVMVTVPDVLVLKQTIRLSDVLRRPDLASRYVRVFCDIGREVTVGAQDALPPMAMAGLSQQADTAASTEQLVIEEILKMGCALQPPPR